MPLIPFAEWRPDGADLDSQFATEAKNVLPGLNSYLPFPSAIPVSVALPAEPRGGLLARNANGDSLVFAGTATKLYKLNTTNNPFTWDDVSRPATTYGVSVGHQWSFAQFGQFLIAVNVNNPPQVFDLQSGATFDNLGGNPPQARLVEPFNDYVHLLAWLSVNSRQQWSATNNIAGWTVGTDNSDFQDHPSGGDITGMSGDAGLVFLRRRIRRITQVSSELVYQFDDFETRRGCVAPYGLVKAGNRVFYLSEEGFFEANPGGTVPIGSKKINDFFFADVTQTEIVNMVGATDAKAPRAYWAYRSVNNAGSGFDRLLIYDWELQRWSRAELMIHGIFQSATPGITLEALDSLFPTGIDAMTISFDSPVFQGGGPVIAVFDSLFRLAFLQGTPLEAIVETAEIQLAAPNRAFVTGAAPVVETSAALASVAARSRRSETLTYRAETAQNSQGECSIRADGRFHRFRVRVPAGEDWSHLQGVNVTASPSGNR